MLLVVDVGEEGPEAVEVGGRVGIVFVVVALGAADRGPHPRPRHVADPVGLVDRPVFLGLQSALVGRLQEAVVAAGEHAVLGVLALPRADEVASQLQFGEPVEGHVVEKCLDHPVAIGRDAVRLVAVVADGVGVADEVEPPGGEPLRMSRRGEQPVHQLREAVGPRVGQIGLDLGGRRRQPRQVERHPAEERERIGVGRRCEPFRLEPGEHEAVDPVRGPRGILHGRRTVPLGRHVGPVLGVGGACGDPRREEFLLGRREHVIALGRRHHDVGIGLVEPGHEFALLGVARHDRAGTAVEFGDRSLTVVEPQPAAAIVLVGAVAGETVVREDRPDVAVEVGRAIGGGGRGGGQRPDERHVDLGTASPRGGRRIGCERHESPRILRF